MIRVEKSTQSLERPVSSFRRSALYRPSCMRQDLPTIRILKYWTPVLLYSCLIVFLSSLSAPGIRVPRLLYGFDDKIIHAIEYAILAVLCYRAYLSTFVRKLAIYAPLFAITTAVLFGLTDEIHQAFVPMRHADVWDLVADGIGAFLGVMVWRWMNHNAAPELSS